MKAVKQRDFSWLRHLPWSWRLVLVGGVCAHVGVFILLGLRPARHELAQPVEPFVYYPAQGGSAGVVLFEEHSSLFDPEPLLLHTPLNYRSSVDLSRFEAQQQVFFEPYAPQLKLESKREGGAALLRVSGSAGQQGRSLPEHILALEGLGVLEGYGQRRVEQIEPLAGVAVPTLRLSNTQGQVLAQERVPAAWLSGQEAGLWEPLRLRFYVPEQGVVLAPPPAQAAGGVIAVEQVRRWLEGRSPQAGYYFVEVGP